MYKWIWVTWEKQERNVGLSQAFGMPLFVFDLPYGGFRRHLVAVVRTLRTFAEQRPGLVVVQNPSLVLAAMALQYGKLFKVPIVVDAHNAGLFPEAFVCGGGAKIKLLKSLARYVVRNAALTIVTNFRLKDYVEQNGGKAEVIPDCIPRLAEKKNQLQLSGRVNVMCVCSYDADEPYLEVIEATRKLDSSVCVYMTGDWKNARIMPNSLPSNLVLTGFLSRADYLDLLWACDIVMDLTTLEDCLVCGAYEGVAAGKPLILSDSKANRAYFKKGVAYAHNTAEDLAQKTVESIRALDRSRREISELRVELETGWEERRKAVADVFAELHRH